MQFEDIKVYDTTVKLNTDMTVSGFNSTSDNQSYSLFYDDRADYYYNNLEALKETRFVVLNQIQKYYVPGLCLLGLLGNVSSAAIFLTRVMRVKSCVNYLLFKCVTDTFFLVSLFVVWLDRVDIKWFHHQGVCQLIIFMTYVSGFMSVWMVVMVTLENYVSICHPQRVSRICRPRRAHVISLALFMFSVLCYNFPIWTISPQEGTNHNTCTHVTGFSQINEGLAYFDTALTLVLPSFLVFTFMYKILKTMIQAFWKIRRRRNLEQGHRSHFFCQTPYGHISVMLLGVSVAFMVIHTPSHVGRLYLIIGSFFDMDVYFASLKFQRHFELLYYTNFAINFFIYFIFGKAFRLLYKRYHCFCGGSSHVDPAVLTSKLDECVCKTTDNEQNQEMVVSIQ